MNLKASDASGRSSRNEKWRTDAGAVEIVGAPAIRVNPARTRRDAIGRKPLFAAFAVRYAVVTPWSPPGHIVAPAERSIGRMNLLDTGLAPVRRLMSRGPLSTCFVCQRPIL